MRRSKTTALLEAAALSALAHGSLLVLLGLRLLHATPVIPAAEPEGARVAIDSADGAATSTMAWVDVVPDPAVTPAPEPIPTPALSGDQARFVAAPTSPGRGTTDEELAAPSPDTGAGAGRRPIEATRRDLSTLRTRSSDGAHPYRQERERTSARASSPQPIRQEPVVGVGDSSRTMHPGAPAMAPETELPSEAEGESAPELASVQPARPIADGRDPSRGDGPLDAEQGRRRFDTEELGVARDDRFARASSDENHPGRIELSRPAAAGLDPNGVGRGPSELPGAVSRTSAGLAPAVRGAEVDAPAGPSIQLSAAEREYLRYQSEIRRRVAGALRFPKRLALLLEQGETVVHFVVRPDGKLEGAVRVVKSAGFDEFDAAAVSAVTRAAPFPATGHPLSVSMPIAFDNPLVR
jgi:TonB family protein